MGGGREAGEKEHRIVLLGIQFPPGFVGNARPAQHSAAIQRKRVRKRRIPACIKYLAGIAAGGVPRAWRAQGSGSPPSLIPSNSGVER